MYKFIGLAMMGVFAMMIIPGNFDTTQSENTFYGMATMVKNDSLGNEAFQQSVHNALTDQGENRILEMIFDDGEATITTGATFGAICVSLASYDNATSIEAATAASFDTADQLATNNCVQVAAGAVNTSSSIATITALQFDADGGNVVNGDTIRSIAICQAINASDADFANCASGGGGGGVVLAVVDVTATTLATGETVDITYTFDITSDSS